MKSKATRFVVPSKKRAALICSAAALAISSGRNRAWADPGQINLALDAAAGGIATATATNSNYGSTADMAIDGDRDGNFNDGSVWYGNSPNSEGTNTSQSTTYSYTVNLGQNDYINRVQFLPRTDVDQGVFGNFNVSIYQGVAGPSNTVVPAASPSFSEDYNSGYFGDTFATADPGNSASGGSASGSYGQFVSITRLDNNYWLTFAEMEVIGASTPLQNTMSNNIALNQPVTTSSAPGFGALKGSGNDGNISGDLSAPSSPVYCSSTAGVGQYWQVDLGGNVNLSYAELFCQDNVGQNNTTQFDVQVYNSSMNLVDSVIVNNNVNGPNPGFDHEINLTGIDGEFIRLSTTLNQYLCFSELEAFAAPTTAQWLSSASGDWNNLDNWSGGVPNGAGVVADFFGAATSNQTVFTNAPITVGTLNFNNSNTYEITGTGSLTLQATSGNAQVIVQQGTHELDLPVTIASNTNLDVSSGATLVVANPITINSGNSITSTGSGTVNFQSIITVDSNASIAFGNSTYANKLSVASTGSASIQGSGNVVEVDTLSNLGTVDITKNELLVNYAGQGDPISSIAGELKSGYNNGAWNGTGIISSAAQTTQGGLHYGVGWADGADHVVAGLSSGEIEVKYTLLGDANLDGVVNGSDFSILAANFGLGHTNWDQGNFLFSSSVNGADFSALAANFGQGVNLAATVSPADIAALDAFAAANGLLADVPEPISMGPLALGALAIFARRRSRARTYQPV